MFSQFKQAMQQNFTSLLAQSQRQLYHTAVDKEVLWNAYLASFPEDVRQEYNCNSCKQFIRHYGGLVAILGNETVSMWSFYCEEPYLRAITALDSLVRDADITDLFFAEQQTMGTDKNIVHGGTANQGFTMSTITWEHMFYKLPKEMVHKGAKSIDTLKGEARDNRNVFKRGLDEITIDAVNTVLELIAQNSLYRGADYTGILTKFKELKTIYDMVQPEKRNNWAWSMAPTNAGSVAQIRNTAIGTLLTDISKGEDLDKSVSAFERIMAPTNYKRPNAIITNKMIEEAEKTITGLGYGTSLGRRFATMDDITVNNLLFVDRSIVKDSGILSDLKAAVKVNPKSLTKVDEVPLDKFITDILPKATSVEVLFENRHVNNLVSLITAKDPKSQGMFKWPNLFSWSYKNAVTDSIKEKVKTAGGRVDGELRVSLAWHNHDDLDLHIHEPLVGTQPCKIWFGQKLSITGGHLDVDMNVNPTTREPVENVIWPGGTAMREGIYQVEVNQYTHRESIDTGFTVEIECQGQLLTFNYDKMVRSKETIQVAQFSYSRKEGVRIGTSIGHNEKLNSKTVWGVETSKFHKTSMIMRSPNCWDQKLIGNAHLFFILDQAHNDEGPRGFFNEFLSPELEKHKRVFEALGSRMKVDPADKQVSGLGFSSTNHGDFIVKVEGSFTRTLKIIF